MVNLWCLPMLAIGKSMVNLWSSIINHIFFMWVKQCHKPPIFLGMVYIPPIKMVIFLGDCLLILLFWPHDPSKTLTNCRIVGTFIYRF